MTVRDDGDDDDAAVTSLPCAAIGCSMIILPLAKMIDSRR